MTDHEQRETRVIHQPHPDAEQRGVVTDVVVPLAQTGITTAGVIAAAKIATNGKGDGKK
jgi:hypothetical protein